MPTLLPSPSPSTVRTASFDTVRPWTEELIPALPERATQRELLEYVACAMRRQLEINMPAGAKMVDGRLVMPPG